jgi:hypothetical protein
MLVIAQRWDAGDRRIKYVVVRGSEIMCICCSQVEAEYRLSLIARCEEGQYAY